MKLPLLILCVGLASASTNSPAQLALETFGEPLDAKNVDIVWNVPSNALPASLTTFKVLPTVFASEIVSNVIQLCGFKDPERVRATFSAVNDGKTISYTEPYPGKPVFGKSLCISPANGFISFSDPTASSLPRVPAEAVPTHEEALELAVALLPKLGISVSDLTHKPASNQLAYLATATTNGRFDKAQKKVVEDVAVRGVKLFRELNGVSFSGPGDCGGVRVEFGNHAKIRELALAWRNLRPDKRLAALTPAEITQAIRAGKAVIRRPEDLADATAIKKITVTQVRPYYYGLSGTDRQKTVYPYLMLTADATTSHTNLVVTLNCPVLR